MIEFTNVSVDVDEYDVEGRHRRVKILSTMNLIVSERRVAVIGPNGAGKSTLLRLVNGLVEATDGTVTVDGINPSEDGRAARRHVGYIFTNPRARASSRNDSVPTMSTLAPAGNVSAARSEIACPEVTTSLGSVGIPMSVRC